MSVLLFCLATFKRWLHRCFCGQLQYREYVPQVSPGRWICLACIPRRLGVLLEYLSPYSERKRKSKTVSAQFVEHDCMVSIN